MGALLLGCGDPAAVAAQGAPPLQDCEWCGTSEAPQQLRSDTRIAPANEPGEPMILEGTVYDVDGTTPMAGVVIYAYHTNVDGIYPKRGDETGNGARHGYLRGWVRSDENGRYRFKTIRPAIYPTGREEAHVHMAVEAPGDEEVWIDSVVFSDDPLVNEGYRERARNRGGSGIVTPALDDGVWRVERDIIVGLNIP